MTITESTQLLKDSKEISENLQVAIVAVTKIIQKTQEAKEPSTLVAEMILGLRKIQEAQFWFQYVQGACMHEIEQNPASKLVVKN